MASSYQTVSYGSSGDAVRQLQSALNKKGYQLAEDGIFGKKTRAAVKAYQKKYGLQIDGIAGQETWGHLMGNQPAAKPGSSTAMQVLSGVSDETGERLGRLEQGYSPSADTEAARAEWESLQALRPGEYESGFDRQLQRIYDQLTGRESFAYDPESDESYRRYAELYAQRGRAAMEDTLGKAAYLTGGYDSSYAQSAGQQAYQSYLQELAELLPQFEKSARERYDAEGEALEHRYDLLQQQENAAYDRWEDAVAAWQREEQAARKSYETAQKQDYDTYKLLLDYYADKAKSEQKASNGLTVNSGKAAPKEQKSSLSSTAAESLERAMGNYLKGGDADRALALLTQYQERLTPAQKKRFKQLFAGYGQTVKL